MSARRGHPEELRARVRARYAVGDLNLRELAETFSLPWTTVQNMVKGRTPPPDKHTVTRVDSTGRAAANRRRRAEAAAVVTTPPVGVVAQAIAERSSGKPLVVESLEQRLEKAIPGAYVVGGRPCDDRLQPWAVWCQTHRLSTAASKLDAVDKAIALWSVR